MSDIQKSIRTYILDTYLADTEADSFRDDDDLLMLLDSLQILRIVNELESQYGIKIETSELSPENLGSVEKLAAMILRKQGECDSTDEAADVSS